MAWTQSDRDALARAIASGHLTVENAGKRITYRTFDEMLKALSMIDRELAEAANIKQLRVVNLVYAGRDY